MCDKKNERLTKRDLYERYWKCRDFEIQNLWQRAIFLGPILVLTFTGYGAFFLKCFVNEKGLLRLLDYPDIVMSHAIAIVIAFMGAIFSILWIFMMKGSKAWFEVYQRAIIAMDTQKGWILPDELLDCCGGFKHERIPGYKDFAALRKNENKEPFDDKICTTRGGLFSPSRINIVIGQVSLAFWFVVIVLHSVLCLVFVIYERTAIEGFHVFNKVFVLLTLFALMITAIITGVFAYNCGLARLKKKCMSTSLKLKDPQNFEDVNKIVVQIYTSNVDFMKERVSNFVNGHKGSKEEFEIVDKCGCLEVCYHLSSNIGEIKRDNIDCNYAILNEKEWINDRISHCDKTEKTTKEMSEVFFEKTVKPVIEEFFKILSKN